MIKTETFFMIKKKLADTRTRARVARSYRYRYSLALALAPALVGGGEQRKKGDDFYSLSSCLHRTAARGVSVTFDSFLDAQRRVLNSNKVEKIIVECKMWGSNVGASS